MQPPRSPEERFTEALQHEVTVLQARFPDLAEALSRAQALVAAGAVFPEDNGREAMVRSSDGQHWYPVNGTCPCPASQHHREPCKHRLAFRLYQKVCDHLVAAAERWDLAYAVPVGQAPRQLPAIPPDGLTMIQGKPFIKFEALLALAHQHGLVGLETTLVQGSVDLAVCQSIARFADGRVFTDIGDASPENVAQHLKPHFIRMAATRASARALRRALNVSTCAVEELGDDATA